MNFSKKNYEHLNLNKVSKTQKKLSKLGLLLITILLISNCSKNDDIISSENNETTDKIELSLTASKALYQNATIDSWIKITEAEFETLISNLTSVIKSGATDTHYNDPANVNSVTINANGITIANNNGATIPSNSYLFAFKYRARTDNTTTTKVKLSVINPMDGYEDLGSELPSHNAGDNYFVLKGSNNQTSGTANLALFSNQQMGFKVLPETTSYFYENNDSSSLTTTGGTDGAIIMYQGLSTTQKQWD